MGVELRKQFNITGLCYPNENYMVDIEKRLSEIKIFVSEGKYFVINRARQYGKTTTLWALQQYLQSEFTAVLLSFQKLSSVDFASEYAFASAFADIFVQAVKSKKIADLDTDGISELEAVAEGKDNSVGLRKLFKILGKICERSLKPLVLMIDEVDNASNNQVFLDFLARLRDNYLDRKSLTVFQSVMSLLYLRPIINGNGNYYVETRTRDMNRTDVVIDYHGKQYIVEMKIHRGEAYERKGIEQLAGYLEEYHLGKGYLLIFNFNKKKHARTQMVRCNGKDILEVVV